MKKYAFMEIMIAMEFLSTTILVQAFLELGKKVGYHIPNRFEDGYGLNKERVQQMYEKGYTLLITVDNGIKAYEPLI